MVVGIMAKKAVDMKKKRTEKSVWLKYTESKGLDPHKSAWSNFKEKTSSSDSQKKNPPSIRFCTQCGAQQPIDTRFCERCGVRSKK